MHDYIASATRPDPSTQRWRPPRRTNIARSKACVFGRSLAGIAGSNPAGGMNVSTKCMLSGRGLAADRSLIQRSPT